MSQAAFTIDPVTASLLGTHAANGSQRQADGAQHYAENLRYDYLIGKGRTDYQGAVAIRHVEESGSGRTRILDPTTAAIKSA